MTQNNSNPENTGDAAVGERVIIDFLRSHPDFFERHPEILAELHIPHASGAASLIERQVSVLREQRSRLTAQLDELYATARENQALADQFHRLLLELLEARTIPDLVAALSRGLRLHCDADAVTLALFSDGTLPLPAPLRTPLSDSAEGRSLLNPFLFAVQPCCGPLEPALAQHLFPEQADAMTSAALLPLALGPDHPGILAVGSSDPEHFTPEQGTHFLEQLAEAAASALRPWVREPASEDAPREQRRS